MRQLRLLAPVDLTHGRRQLIAQIVGIMLDHADRVGRAYFILGDLARRHQQVQMRDA
jgi:hypothetical protein